MAAIQWAGIAVICLKTFQSISNFLNCEWVISATTCDGVTGADLVNQDAVILLGEVGIVEVGGCSVTFKIHKRSPITVSPS